MLGFAFLVAVVSVVLAVVFWFQGQSAVSVVKALRGEMESARKEAETARAELKKNAEELKARSAQLVETREKLTDSRKKAQEGKGGKTQSRGAREAEMEEDLVHARKLTEDAHAAESAARRDLAAAKGAEAQAKSELSAAQTKIRELSNRTPPPPSPVAQPAVAAALPPDYEVQRTQLEAARSELERQVKQAERNAREARQREQELKEETKKQKGRAETNNRVYLVTKGELELTTERLAQAERKLWQAGIPLDRPAAKERPRATGPASADKPREEAAPPEPPPAEAEAEAAAAAVVAREPSEPPRTGEPIAAAPEGTPTPAAGTPTAGVAPIRRRPD